MFSAQQLALANLRFLARGGQSPAYYDHLEELLGVLVGEWKSLTLSDNEALILSAQKRLLQCELTYLKSVAVRGALR